jgi:hypothetical protein
VTIAPECTHHDRRDDLNAPQPCDLGTFLQRGWCRLENLSRLSLGPAGMFNYTGDNVLRYTGEDDEMVRTLVQVFSGQFTVESDKERLVPVMLGLWNSILQARFMGTLLEQDYDEKVYQATSIAYA